MHKYLVFCVVLFSLIALEVQSKSIYRNGRELKVDEVLKRESVAETNLDPVRVEIIQPVVVVKEEVLIPVETLQNVEQIAEVDEPEPIVSEDELRKDEEEIIDAQEQASENEAVVVHPDDGLRVDTVEEVIEEQKPQKIQEEQQPIHSAPANNILKQSAASSTVRPSLIQQAQQIISNNPLGQFIDSIRRPSTKAPDGAAVEQLTVQTTTPPNIFQQIQQGVQSIGNQIGTQISTALNPAQTNLEASESNPSETVVRPPNFFETIQSNFQNTVNGIFRPNGEQGTQPGPFQTVLSNVQNFLAGNRPENGQAGAGGATPAAGAAAPAQIVAANDAPQKVGLPVDDKVDFTKNSGEVHEDPSVAAESTPLVEVIELTAADGQKGQEEESVVLVTNEASLENDAD